MLRAVILGGLLLLALLAGLLVWRLQPGQALAVAPGDEIRYGSFGFTVEGVRRAPSIRAGGAAVDAHGEFVIVTLRVHNHGPSGDLAFPTSAARLIDGEGAAFIPHEAGTAALAMVDGPIPAGESCTAEVAFDVPPGTRVQRLAMQFEGPIFELAEMLVHGRRWLVLPE